MNTVVNFEIAKLLKEKRFESESKAFYDGSGELFYYNYSNNVMQRFRYSAPTIAEVVMWLYEKHGIWIEVNLPLYGKFKYTIITTKSFAGTLLDTISDDRFEEPTEAYEAAINYCLKEII